MVKVVLDTNVLLSGLFFGGIPLKVIEACINGTACLVVSPEIIDEYKEAGRNLQKQRPLPTFFQVLSATMAHAMIVRPPALAGHICRDPDDDKFIACLMASNADCIVSGDKDLLSLPPDSRTTILVLRPREFMDIYVNVAARGSNRIC